MPADIWPGHDAPNCFGRRSVQLVMRACAWTVRTAVCLLAAVAFPQWAAPADAKGERISYYLPGERWTSQSDWGFGSVRAARQGEKREWVAYLVGRGDEYVDGELVAPVLVQHLRPRDRWLRFRVSFRIPDVPGGVYRVVICNVGCAQPFGNAWLVRRVIVFDSASERLIMHKIERSTVGVTRELHWRLEQQHDLIEAVELEQTVAEVALKKLEAEVVALREAARHERGSVDWWLGLAVLLPVAGLMLWRHRG